MKGITDLHLTQGLPLIHLYEAPELIKNYQRMNRLIKLFVRALTI